MYAKLTQDQKHALLVEYRRARELGACDVLHAVAIAAHSVLNRGNVRTLNSGKGADAQAAALFFLVFSGEIKAVDELWPKRILPLVMTEVRIRRGEGPNTSDFSWHTFKGANAEEDGNAYLRYIAQTAPQGGGYDKTDVEITFENGREWEARFDVKYTGEPDNDTDLRQHVRDFLYFHLNPQDIPWVRELRDPREREERVASIKACWNQETRDEAQTLLNLIEGRR